jgi:MFS family permease
MTTTAPRTRFYYGWVIVACAWLANFTTTSANPLVFSFFLFPMSESLGLKPSDLVWGITIRSVAGGLFAPYFGQIIDRHGSRWPGALSGIVVGATLIGFSSITNIWVLYALFFVSGLTGFSIFGGNVLTIVPPANWFIAKRGRAISIASSGQLVGSAASAIAAAFLIGRFGWQTAWAIFGVIAFLGVTPGYALFMRRKPEDMGLLPDGAAPRTAEEAAADAAMPAAIVARGKERYEFTVGEALRTPALILHVAAFTTMLAVISPFLLFRNHYWQELGFSPQLIAIGIALDPFTVAVMSIAMGVVAERVPIRYVGAFGGVWRLLGMLPLTLGATWPASVLVHNFVWGIGSGTTSVFQTLMIPDYFGRAHQGAIRGAVTPVMVIVGSLGGPLGGYLLDAGMSYSMFFWGIFGAVGLASASILLQTPPRPPARLQAEADAHAARRDEAEAAVSGDRRR